MEFGLGLLGYQGCWNDAAFAETHGFTSAGFVDSPLLAGDPFVALALAAQATSSIRIGTFVAVPSNRITATTASGIATVNRLAPGRTFLALGSGYTSRNTFGLPAVPAATLGEYARECRALLSGEEVLHHEGSRQRPIRFCHGADRYVNTGPPIPVYVAADGPKALAEAGRSGDGWITTLQFAGAMFNAAEVFSASLQVVREATDNAADPYTIWSTTICVLTPGESVTSERVLRRVGAHAMMPFHSYADNPAIGERLPEFIKERLPIYEQKVLARFDPDRRHQETHRGHLSHLLEGEAAVLTEQIIRATCLVGTADEVVNVLAELETAGLKNLSLWVPPDDTRDAVLEVEREIMPRLRR